LEVSGRVSVEVIPESVEALIAAVWWEWAGAGDGAEGAEGAEVRADDPHDEELPETVHPGGLGELPL
jgi:hypothetical protein